MVDEAPDAGLSPAREALVEVDEFADGGEGIIIGALGWGSFTEHVGEQGRMANFLIGHEFDVGAVFGCEAGGEEVVFGENREAVVEEVEFDPFLIKTESDGFKIKVRVYHVSGQAAVGTETT